MLHTLWDHVRTLTIAFFLAFFVWVAAVNAADPLDVRSFPSSVPIDFVGLQDSLVIVDGAPATARVTIRAPGSVWDLLTSRDVHVEARLNSLGVGTHELTLVGTLDRKPALITQIEPARLELSLEEAASRSLSVRAALTGEPALGYRMDDPVAIPESVHLSGPASLVDRVVEVVAQTDVTGRREDIDTEVALMALDTAGQVIEGVSLEPATARVVTTVHQLVGYRLVAVIPIIKGQVEAGYQVSSITVSPTLVTVFSPDPQAVDDLPGYVETESLNLTGAQDDIQEEVGLQLPEGIFLAGDQSVIVQIQVAPIETTINVTRPVVIEGLAKGLYAESSPATASVILKGPLPVLNKLLYDDVRVVVNVDRLAVGAYQLTPQVIILPEGVVLQTLLPETYEIVISRTPPATPATPAP
ncbi:MAG: CdaR family protein [Chloroflexi bacterium]|nr:CdaR family protein [Chloroflexota bacterium]